MNWRLEVKNVDRGALFCLICLTLFDEIRACLTIKDRSVRKRGVLVMLVMTMDMYMSMVMTHSSHIKPIYNYISITDIGLCFIYFSLFIRNTC